MSRGFFGNISSWLNGRTGQGGSGDHGSDGYAITRPEKTHIEITELLKHHPFMRIACEVMAADIVRAWRNHKVNPAKWEGIEERLDYRSVTEKALFYSDGYGGAFILPRYKESAVTVDDLALPRKPITSDSLLGFTVIAPHQIAAANGIGIFSITNTLPEYYTIPLLVEAGMGQIHQSWIYAMGGAQPLPMFNYNGNGTMERLIGQSKVDMIYSDYARLATAYDALKHILVKGNIDVLKVVGLAAKLRDCTNDTMRQAAINAIMDSLATVSGANTFQPMVIDQSEALERHSGNNTAAALITDHFLTAFIATSRIPRIKFLGEHSKGLGNGGEINLRTYLDDCGTMRERRLTRCLNWMDSLAGIGSRAPQWEYVPLWEEPPSSVAATNLIIAQTDQIYHEMELDGIGSGIRTNLKLSGTYQFEDSEQ